MQRTSLIVVALGGNAISRETEEGNVDQQFAHSREASQPLADLIVAGHQLVLTHGNGPQIGNFMLRNEAAAGVIYPLAMEVAAAHVQGGMGFMISQTLTNELNHRGDTRQVVTIITNVLVDPADPAFKNPTKPVGREIAAEDAQRYSASGEWTVKEMKPGKFRRVVASPSPKQILEIEHIRRAIAANEILVTCGGGGIPVVREANGDVRGIRAVIDKDLASALLAAELNADALMILTAVDRVRLNFGKPDERAIDSMTVAEAEGWMKDGQFPAGSMGPKVQAAINFVRGSRNPRAAAYIGLLEQASDVIAGKTGTRISF